MVPQTMSAGRAGLGPFHAAPAHAQCSFAHKSDFSVPTGLRPAAPLGPRRCPARCEYRRVLELARPCNSLSYGDEGANYHHYRQAAGPSY